MKEEFKESAWRDFQQRFQGTYGWFEKASGGSVLVQLTDVDEMRCKFVDKEGASFTATADKGNLFSFFPVQRGLYNTSDSVIACKRLPAKQYRRGLCQNNTTIYDLDRGETLELTFSLVEDMFGNHPNLRLAKFKQNYQGNLAINRQFGVVNGKLFLYDFQLGIFDENKREFILGSKLFEQEVKDLINEHQFDLTVSIK